MHVKCFQDTPFGAKLVVVAVVVVEPETKGLRPQQAHVEGEVLVFALTFFAGVGGESSSHRHGVARCRRRGVGCVEGKRLMKMPFPKTWARQ